MKQNFFLLSCLANRLLTGHGHQRKTSQPHLDGEWANSFLMAQKHVKERLFSFHSYRASNKWIIPVPLTILQLGSVQNGRDLQHKICTAHYHNESQTAAGCDDVQATATTTQTGTVSWEAHKPWLFPAGDEPETWTVTLTRLYLILAIIRTICCCLATQHQLNHQFINHCWPRSDFIMCVYLFQTKFFPNCSQHVAHCVDIQLLSQCRLPSTACAMYQIHR